MELTPSESIIYFILHSPSTLLVLDVVVGHHTLGNMFVDMADELPMSRSRGIHVEGGHGPGDDI